MKQTITCSHPLTYTMKAGFYESSWIGSRNKTLTIMSFHSLKDANGFLRHGYFKPSSGMNPEHQKLYSQNRFSIVRQLKYSKRNENSLDITIFLNGLPIITAELKNSLTGQFVENAIKQYKKDRDPREPLFQFKRCFVHFAVGNEKVYMTTRLQGDGTRFLPFTGQTLRKFLHLFIIEPNLALNLWPPLCGLVIASS